ncbi:oxidoreductase [Labilibaculum filiforme]|uniref:Oxidoreductase n=1 Tax=Labilibaculum filiforme TaxID=1940526 RepID=A0A2N3I1R3_9BACT|nr:Gfo/Idh/MocA family oxidoreductase [Labilibaculum filiforme]PKQ64252.1 oxidoreductase [Labilibaculum filiforme]
MVSRRNFIRNAAVGAAGISLLSSTSAFGSILGSNEMVNVAILGTGGRSHGLVPAVAGNKNARVIYICDADKSRMEKFQGYCEQNIGYSPKMEQDFRKILEDKEVDAVVIATPEHWHAPMAIMALQAGKHVYVEKPCSHNPHENELLVAAQKKYNKVVQMGNQQRSSFTSALAVKEIGEGVIGDVYAAKAFYANTRKPIGKGKVVNIPSSLNWDLWQGPAPREDYRDNIHPYNWHWFRTWGTGEIHNNGTHEIDICRWALGVNYPTRVVSTGGRLHHSDDDWEWFDTQMASYEFDGGKTITWEGRSCNGYKPNGGRSATIYGTNGTIRLDRSNYTLFDLDGKKIKQEWEKNQGSSNDTSDTKGFDGLTVTHMDNFIAAIRENEQQNSPIAEAAISTQLCHLGNIAQDLQESLLIDPKTGRVLNNEKAMKMWKRDYEKGWELKL